jgi:hypothetical protein
MSTAPETCRALIDKFAWYEKVLARLGVVALVGVGAWGMYLQSPVAAVVYLVLAGVGGVLVIFELLCVYCPYPYQQNDCLFFPPQLLTRLTERRHGAISPTRKTLLALVGAGLVLIPQYWLWGNWALLAGFWVLVALIGLGFGLHFCRRCRHGQCPLNSAARTGSEPGGNEAEPPPEE